ncbi:hypothetical protein H5410_002326 [Solanum commersonii]|uniref:Uncharacterized protein n=1 Tax=Solanum commersonii TaxID=4109 RepID=A0A9J6B1M7_SOLCO|nr:hypothetical protein H5410_002326 [Solanum commersonii]
MTLVMNLSTLPLIFALNMWVFVFLAIEVICVGFTIYNFLLEIGKECEMSEANIWKLHWFWKKVLPKEDSRISLARASHAFFLLLLFANVVLLTALLYLWLSYRLVHSWGRKLVLICGSTFVVLRSLLTAWFPNIIFEFIGLEITWIWRGVPISVFLLSVLLNETQQFLIKQGRVEEVKLVLKRIHKSGEEEELQELAYLIEYEDREPWQKLLHSLVLEINFIIFKYHTTVLAPFLGGAIRDRVAGVLSLRYLCIYFPCQSSLIFQIYLTIQFLPIYEDFLFFVYHGENLLVHLKQQTTLSLPLASSSYDVILYFLPHGTG